MDIKLVLKQLDDLYMTHRENEVEGFLTENLTQALGEGDTGAVLSLLNEMVGYYRDANRYDEALLFSEKALNIMENAGLSGTKEYATTLINRANAQRAAGYLDEAIVTYNEVEVIYERVLEQGAFDFSGLYNNLSLVYMEQEDYEKAIECLEKALAIVEPVSGGNTFELAVTHANLGNSILHGRKDMEAARTHLSEAAAIFEKRNLYETHYAAAVAGLGECEKADGNIDGAAECFDKALAAIYQNFGLTDFFYRMKEFRDEIESSLQEKAAADAAGAQKTYRTKGFGLKLCRAYFDEIVYPAIKKDHPEILKKAAFGLSGYGSDCYGFDDVYSRDHDWGPGVCIWLRRSDYEECADVLKKWYETLNKSFRGYKRRNTPQGEGRVGVLCFEDFVEEIVGKAQGQQLLEFYEKSPDKVNSPNGEFLKSLKAGTGSPDPRSGAERDNSDSHEAAKECFYTGSKIDFPDQRLETAGDGKESLKNVWRSCSQMALGCITNGEIFYDESGFVSGFRKFVAEGYPDDLRRAFMAQSCALFSQTLQYNVRRLVLRKDRISLDMILSEGEKETLKLCHYIAGRYVPHDKWLSESAASSGFKDDLFDMMTQIRGAAADLLKIGPVERDFAVYDGKVNALAGYLAGKIAEAGYISKLPEAGNVYLEDLAGKILRA